MTNTAHHRHFSVVVLYLKVHTAYLISVYIEHNDNYNYYFLTMMQFTHSTSNKANQFQGTGLSQQYLYKKEACTYMSGHPSFLF